ncbi:MAG TPA: serine hydrolase domain-containing protein, partial [Acidimicrobiales bacterium]|nr:serine hydrolase domain-containing protein [Acidimicrobiales bacterium]
MNAERTLPSRPSLRHLRLEAKRRQGAGEFETLHDAQLAVAREHGMSSWAALKRLVQRPPEDGVATPRLRSLLSRFAGAREPSWVAPDDGELGEHFTDAVLARVPREALVARLAERGPAILDAGLEVVHETRTSVRVRFGRSELTVVVEARPPHRIAELRLAPIGGRIGDARTAEPPSQEHGAVPSAVRAIGDAAFVDLGLVGLSLAGGRPHSPAWVSSRGWANLDHGEALSASHRFPAYGITHPVTATTVLVLVASGRITLDRPANAYLQSIRLGDDAATVRELLTHTGGVDHPVPSVGDEATDVIELLGPIVTCSGQRGMFRYSNEGYGVLGQMIADVTGVPYPVAVDRLVFAPLGMRRSSFPTRWPSVTSDAVTGYHVGGDGFLVPEPPLVATIPAAGGM